jgi:hypothetical protein
MSDEQKDRTIIDTQQVGVSTDAKTGEKVVEVEPVPTTTSGKRLYKLDLNPPEALVIHCAEPKYQRAFREFINNELGIRNYAPVIIGGGVHAFGAQNFLPKNFKILWEQVKFFVKDARVRQIIIINHEGCQWYEKLKGFHPTIDLPIKGKLDLGRAARVILDDFAGVNVRMFWASLHGDQVSFSELTTAD